MACVNPSIVWEVKPSPGYPGRKQQVPCGTCILCRQEQARQNAVLILHEAKQAKTACMITLTYSDEHVPEYNSLQYADVQKLWKRLRKAGKEFRYFAAGEYGELTHRPHYHACVFGLDWTDDQIIVKYEPLTWISPTLELEWGLGQARLSALNFSTAAYAASYVQKKLASQQKYVRIDEQTGELIELEQPRAHHSTELGQEWYDTYKQGVLDHDHVIINGQKHKPPRAYDLRLKDANPKEYEELKKKRKKKAKENKLTREETHARARNAHARARRKDL